MIIPGRAAEPLGAGGITLYPIYSRLYLGVVSKLTPEREAFTPARNVVECSPGRSEVKATPGTQRSEVTAQVKSKAQAKIQFFSYQTKYLTGLPPLDTLPSSMALAAQ